MIIPSLRFLSFFNKIYIYTDKSVLKQFWRWVYCIQTEWDNNFSSLMKVGNRNLELLRVKRSSFAHGTDVDLSKLVTPPSAEGDWFSQQFADTEKSYLRFSLSPAWNLHRRLISRQINFSSELDPHIEPLALTRARNASSRQNPSNPRANAGNIIVHSTNSAIIY